MPTEQRTDPQLERVTGHGMKQVSNGVMAISIEITGDPAMGYPPEDELDQALLELFAAVGAIGWLGSVTKSFRSSHTIYADVVAPPDTGEEGGADATA